jgi:hypothetical protein
MSTFRQSANNQHPICHTCIEVDLYTKWMLFSQKAGFALELFFVQFNEFIFKTVTIPFLNVFAFPDQALRVALYQFGSVVVVFGGGVNGAMDSSHIPT